MTILFYIFAAIMLLFGLGVVVNRNPVSSALCLVVSFLGLAALYIQLDAFFLGIIQILVYAGAVMVLFLFIIMLLDLKAESVRKFNYLAFSGGIVLTVVFVVQLAAVLNHFEAGKVGMPMLSPDVALEADTTGLGEAAMERLKHDRLPDVHLVGRTIFTQFNFPLQIVGVLLLVSTVGVVILSKRKLT